MFQFETGEDKWCWKLNNSGVYSVASLRTTIDDMWLRLCGPPTVWLKMVPVKIRVHNWRVRLNRLPTKDNLLRRRISLNDDTCELCHELPETLHHLLINCRKVVDIRNAIKTWWDFFPTNCGSIEDLLADANASGQSTRKELLAAILVHAYTWVIWNGRNNTLFNEARFDPLITANAIQFTAYQWCRARSSFGTNMSWANWCCFPSTL